VHWTDGLKKVLNYNPQTASAVDNGRVWSLFNAVFLLLMMFRVGGTRSRGRNRPMFWWFVFQPL